VPPCYQLYSLPVEHGEVRVEGGEHGVPPYHSHQLNPKAVESLAKNIKKVSCHPIE
jgi:hypothetical protein